MGHPVFLRTKHFASIKQSQLFLGLFAYLSSDYITQMKRLLAIK